MIYLAILASVALLFLVFLAFQVWRRYSYAEPPGTATLTPVDLEAFENLMDPAEEKYLRDNLSASEFRFIQRLRIRAAKLYVAALSENAAKMLAFCQFARLQSEPEVAATGQMIVPLAIRLKIWCLLTAFRLNVALIFPTLVFPALVSPSTTLATRYVAVKSMIADLPAKSAA